MFQIWKKRLYFPRNMLKIKMRRLSRSNAEDVQDPTGILTFIYIASSVSVFV